MPPIEKEKLKALEQAADRLKDQVVLDLHFQPFELNPQMGPEGQDIAEHLHEKYGASPEQSERNREAIAARGAELGFTFRMDQRSRIYNTFDAHRLLHWAAEKGLQAPLKHALFKAYFTDGQNPGSHEVLADLAAQVGLDADEARAERDRLVNEVKTFPQRSADYQKAFPAWADKYKKVYAIFSGIYERMKPVFDGIAGDWP